MDFSGGVKQWDKCKLRTALEWVVFTSSSMFDDDEFRVMCQAFYEAGGVRDTAPCLRKHTLLKYVNAVEEGAQTGRLCSPVEESAQTGRLFFAVAETLGRYDGSG